MVFWNVTPC